MTAINIGGLNARPEEAKEVINRHPEVQILLVRTKTNPITGALVVTHIVQMEPQFASRDVRALQGHVQLLGREALFSHKAPAAINFIPALAVPESASSFSLGHRKYLPESASDSYIYAKPCNPRIEGGKTEAVTKALFSREIGGKSPSLASTGRLQNGHYRAHLAFCRSTKRSKPELQGEEEDSNSQGEATSYWPNVASGSTVSDRGG